MADSSKRNAAFSSDDLTPQLLDYLLHADSCKGHECTLRSCETIKQVLSHKRTCTLEEDCTFPHCYPFKQLINHWRHSSPTKKCKLCFPTISNNTNDDKEVARFAKSQGGPQQRKQKSGDPKNQTISSDLVKEENRGIVGNKRGIDFHYYTVMLLCLEGYLHKLSNPDYNYRVHQEDAETGKFDDIVYEYKDNKDEQWTSLLIQCKNKKSLKKSIKTSNLVSDHKKETFSLVKFVNSSKKIENTDNCHFIIYTNISFELEENGYLRQWYKNGKQVSLLTSKVNCFPIFGKGSQYKFDNEINIPKFCEHTNIVKEDWETFLNKLVFVVVDQPNLEDSKRVIEEKIEYILPKSTEKIWNILYEMVNRSLFDQTIITSQEISTLFETMEKNIQEGHDNKYEEGELEFICNLPEVNQFLTSEFTTLPIVTTNPEFTLHKVCKVIKKLRENKFARKYTMKHVYSVKDKKNVSSPNLVIIVIKNSDQLELYKTMKTDDIKKYIIIVLNDEYLPEFQNSFDPYRDVDHRFNLLTVKSKQKLLNKKCIPFNKKEFSFSEFLQIDSISLTEQQEEELNGVITEDVLKCFFNADYENLKLCFNYIDKTEFYITRRLRCSKDSNIEEFKKLYKTSEDTIAEDKLCRVDAHNVLISDMPGMGKSYLVSNMFNELQKNHPAQIIIRLKLINHTTSFDKNKGLNFYDLETIVNFIINELLINATLSPLSQNVLNYILKKNKKTTFIFLDGFDEICPDYNEIVGNFIESIMKYKNYKLIVTTRPGQTDILEQKLSTFALSLEEFTEQDKLSYLNKRLELKDEDAKPLLKKINKNSKIIKLLGVPLLLYIVVETYEKDDNLDLDLFQLFNKFINEKFKIYTKEKKLQNDTNPATRKENKNAQEGYEEQHEALALKLLFRDKIETCIEIDYELIPKIGIIIQVNNERADFIHRTFAEYFVATYVQKNFNKDIVIKLLLTDVLVKNDLTALRQFINNYIPEKISDVKTIDKYRRYVNDNYKNIEEDNPVFSVLCATADENNSKIATFILECFKQNQNMLDIIMSFGKQTALRTAIVNSNIKVAKQIINYCDKNKMNKQCKAYKFIFGEGYEYDRTALQWAADEGHTEVVSLLLDKGASVDRASTDGWTALQRAASEGHIEVVSLLLAKGASVDISITDGWTALHWAARWGHTEVVSLLLDKGASVDRANTDGWTALHWAASKGYIEMVSLLLAKGASVDRATTDGRTALHVAASKGHTEVVSLLLDKGISVDMANTYGWTPLHVAASGGYIEMVSLLLAKGASVDRATTDGRTALHVAASKGNTEVVSLLLDKGISVDMANTYGWTALHVAASGGHTEVVSLLLAKGASVDISITDGWTALHKAAIGGHTEVVRVLLAEGASVDMANTDGWTPLHWATTGDHTEVVSLLLAKGASVDITDTDDWTPLHVAASKGHTEVVQQLIDHGADVNITDNKGLTALQMAKQKNHTGTVEVLQSGTKTSQ